MVTSAKFEIFKAVVITNAVFVMNAFVSKEVSSQVLYHDVDVFSDDSDTIDPNGNIPIVDRTTTFPVGM